MTDKQHEPEEPENGPEGETSAADLAAEELVEVEGPDVEVGLGSPEGLEGFSDEDLAFLASGGQQAPKDAAAEHLADLKRITAEFANYRKRVERDREAAHDIVVAEVVKSLLPVLDDLSLAEQHGDLAEGPMAVIAQKLRGSLERFGLTTVGATGDVFDPHLHEALVQLPTPGATGNTVADVVAPGYKIGDRLLRPAKVAVAVPAE